MLRIGQGVDFHQLVEGRDLWIGGIKIPHDKGAKGIVMRMYCFMPICDAMLGALCLGDIGTHFPDTSSEFKNIDSKILLKRSYFTGARGRLYCRNVDSTICLEKPRIKPYVLQMQEAIASILLLTPK
jgi:2-C-methyl-D-erythritol 2,4-cyclodiphosphate synthase